MAGGNAPRRQSLSRKVVEAVAEREGVPPSELRESLFAVVDPDALDVLFAGKADGAPRGGGRVSFTYVGYDVTVYSDGRVQITEPED